MTPTSLAYRQSAVQAGAELDLLIAMYDTLALNLRRAAEAERNNDLEARGRELNHAFLLISHLEEWLNRGSGGELADMLRAFYAGVKRKALEAQVKRSAAMLDELMRQVLEMRGTWQDREPQANESVSLPPVARMNTAFAVGADSFSSQGSWTA
jgi:flagellar protein FliS